MKVCVPSLNISIIRWVMLPLPGEAYEYLPGSRFTAASMPL